jgi:hypothetical protein
MFEKAGNGFMDDSGPLTLQEKCERMADRNRELREWIKELQDREAAYRVQLAVMAQLTREAMRQLDALHGSAASAAVRIRANGEMVREATGDLDRGRALLAQAAAFDKLPD